MKRNAPCFLPKIPRPSILSIALKSFRRTGIINLLRNFRRKRINPTFNFIQVTSQFDLNMFTFPSIFKVNAYHCSISSSLAPRLFSVKFIIFLFPIVVNNKTVFFFEQQLSICTCYQCHESSHRTQI